MTNTRCRVGGKSGLGNNFYQERSISKRYHKFLTLLNISCRGLILRTFRFFVSLVLMILVLNFSNLAYTDTYSNTIEVFKKSPVVQTFFKNAYGYAVFPSVGKGGIGIGGAYGKGQVYRGGKVTGTAKLFKATIGFQLGGQVFSDISSQSISWLHYH